MNLLALRRLLALYDANKGPWRTIFGDPPYIRALRAVCANAREDIPSEDIAACFSNHPISLAHWSGFIFYLTQANPNLLEPNMITEMGELRNRLKQAGLLTSENLVAVLANADPILASAAVIQLHEQGILTAESRVAVLGHPNPEVAADSLSKLFWLGILTPENRKAILEHPYPKPLADSLIASHEEDQLQAAPAYPQEPKTPLQSTSFFGAEAVPVSLHASFEEFVDRRSSQREA